MASGEPHAQEPHTGPAHCLACGTSKTLRLQKDNRQTQRRDGEEKD